jgi:hypothetical protein
VIVVKYAVRRDWNVNRTVFISIGMPILLLAADRFLTIPLLYKNEIAAEILSDCESRSVVECAF